MQVVLLSAPIIEQMLNDRRFMAFDCFKDPPRMPVVLEPPRQGCGGCGRMEVPRQAPLDYNQIKQRILTMPAEQKAQLRAQLDCTKVVVQYKRDDGSVQLADF